MTDQMVALKILPAELAIHADIKARFIEEAKALARLEHPNIVRLYNFGEEGGRFVLAMQYVEGTTFERRIFSAGRLDWREAAAIMCQVLEGLEFAHARGIIHRDIKPSNILVRGDGSAMIMDFGIAKMAEGGSSRLTATGQTMGTVRYMSPEQVRGHVVDHRSDLYSVGATLYESIVGDTPFDGATHFEIMMKHLNQAPPSARGARASDVPVALDAVIVRALAKDIAARYQAAGQFREALEKVLDEAEPAPGAAGSTPSPKPWRKRREGVGSEEVTTDYPSLAKKKPASELTGLAKVLEPDEPRPARARRWWPPWLCAAGRLRRPRRRRRRWRSRTSSLASRRRSIAASSGPIGCACSPPGTTSMPNASRRRTRRRATASRRGCGSAPGSTSSRRR
jgi:serine/threonine-protein kinase